MINVDAILIIDSKKSEKDINLMLDYKDEMIIENIIKEMVRANCFKNIVAVFQHEGMKEILNKYEIKSVFNLNYKLGTSEAIKLAFEVLGESEGTMIFSENKSAMKYLNILKIWGAFIENPEKIIVPYINMELGKPIVFPYKLYEKFKALKEDEDEITILKHNIKDSELINITG